MKLSKILAILMAVLISPVISFASEDSPSSEREYVKLIEEGKTWEYIYISSNYEHGDFSAFQMRFDGTEIRNGVEYNKLVYCGNLTTWYTEDYRTRPLIVSNLSDRPNDIDAYYLMREEDGKVYLYIKDLIDGKINPRDVLWSEDGIPEIGDETIIYDFTKMSGEIMENLLCADGSLLSEIYPIRSTMWFFADLTLKSVSRVNCNGKSLRLQKLSYYDDRYSCMEGVGVISSGFLPYIDYTSIPACGRGEDYYLNSLKDAGGEIIYKAKDGDYIDVAKIIDMADVEQPVIGPSIARGNDGIKAEDAVITLFDLSGRMVVSSYETVSTISLQPGVYIAKAESPSGISTLKIRIE